MSPAWAATVSIQAQVPELEVSQTTRVTVVVVGERSVPVPRIEPVDGLEIRFAERSSRFESTPQTGLLRTLAFTYYVTPTREGDFRIGPVTVEIPNAEPLRTESVLIRARPRGERTANGEDIVVQAGFPREVVWEGEVVLYQAELTARVPVGNVAWSLPDLQGLARPAHGDMVSQTTEIGDPRGDITQVRSTIPLVATGTGDRTQPPAVAKVDVLQTGPAGFPSRRRTKHVPATKPAKLRIKPLPEAPDGYTGLVGEFRVQSRLGVEKAVVGQTVPWTVTVAGDGVVDGFDLPAPTLEGARVYRDTAEDGGRLVDGAYVGAKTFRLHLVPTAPGELDLPPLDLVVFSPKQGRYTTLSVDPGSLVVTGEAAEGDVKSFASGDVPLESAAPVELVDVYTWGVATVPPTAPVLPFLWLAVSLPGGLLLVGEGASATRAWWRRRRAANVKEVRGADRLKSLPADGAERLAVLDLALREALAAHVKVPVGTLRRPEALAALHDDLQHRVENAFASLDRCRFAGEAPGPDLEVMVRDAIGRLA